jgi:hypothetical protein
MERRKTGEAMVLRSELYTGDKMAVVKWGKMTSLRGITNGTKSDLGINDKTGITETLQT